uniref:RNase H family protein n=1 Tax=Solanum tuberosum TaxID=4113 RepID=M1AQG9_SOLTU
MVIQHVPPFLVPKILNTKIHFHEAGSDVAIWKLKDDSLFTCASAWELTRQKKNKNIIITFSWHKNIPFKISFLLWRALRGKLPINEKIRTFGGEPVRCHCCIKSGWDDINHIFVTGNFATYNWKYYVAFFGISHRHMPLGNLLMDWWGGKPKNSAHKLLLQAVPIIVCWILWKNRCSSKYGGKKSSILRVKFLIFNDTTQLMSTVFPYIQWPNSW